MFAGIRSFWNSSWTLFWKRGLLVAFLNGVYFSTILVTAFFSQFLPPSFSGFSSQVSPVPSFEFDNVLSMILGIFLFNFCVSAFLVVTLPGVVFFGFSVALLVARAALWGYLINQLPILSFLLALPTLVLEGEGYVVASLAGAVLGLSWLKPEWMYKSESVGRMGAFKHALRECGYWFFLVGVLLFFAAVIEALTLLKL